MSQYKDFCWEFLRDEVLENEHGFAQFRFLNEKQVYLINIWVSPTVRETGQATRLANEVARIAKLRGAVEMIGSVVPTALHSTQSLKILLAYKMKLTSASDNLILFSKEI